eukprot:scaffold55416_cov63-Phaeocystis_antarctica.AAC.1
MYDQRIGNVCRDWRGRDAPNVRSGGCLTPHTHAAVHAGTAHGAAGELPLPFISSSLYAHDAAEWHNHKLVLPGMRPRSANLLLRDAQSRRPNMEA